MSISKTVTTTQVVVTSAQFIKYYDYYTCDLDKICALGIIINTLFKQQDQDPDLEEF